MRALAPVVVFVATGEFFRSLLVHRIPIRIDLMHFAQIQFPDPRLDLTHISHDHPYQMIRQEVFLCDLVRALRRQGQRFLRERVVVVLRQAILQELP